MSREDGGVGTPASSSVRRARSRRGDFARGVAFRFRTGFAFFTDEARATRLRAGLAAFWRLAERFGAAFREAGFAFFFPRGAERFAVRFAMVAVLSKP